MLNDDEKKRLYHNIAGSLGKCSEVVIKDQMQLFLNVHPELADKVQEEMANSEPPKPEPKPATV
ncbi:MAG TPA: catalase-related domain-containing protein [Coleofasciculaceae cyanobacterium]|jgi:catalase